MAEFLTTRGVSSKIEDIIRTAKMDLYLVSPYLKLSKTFFTRLKDASDNGVKIRVIYGKDELKPAEKDGLTSIKSLELYFCETLHAKCYFNEIEMVITSMNMYEYSELNNQEMGVFISYPTDRKLFDDAKRETLSIMKNSVTKHAIIENKPDPKNRNLTPNINFSSAKVYPRKGYCIRCRIEISFNVQKPYCPKCFSFWEWNQNADTNFPENYCHECGKPETTAMWSPRCKPCYKKE